MNDKVLAMLKKAKSRFLLSLGCMRPGEVFRKKEKFGFTGDYGSWAEALRDSSGYDSTIILEKTTAACLEVIDGKAAYERDSVIFDEIQYAWPLLAGLMWVAAQSQGKLNVLDFGGSLGTTYYQNRRFLMHLPEVRWNIVEQPDHVEVGKTLFQNKELRFYATIEECLNDTSPSVLILSSVLHYLKEPYSFLDEVLSLRFPHMIFDRTLFLTGNFPDRLTVQRISPKIYEASVPCWQLNLQKFLSYFKSKYELVVEFEGFQEGKGFIFRLKGEN